MAVPSSGILKPTNPRLRRGHPLSNGLVGAWAFYEASGGNGSVVHNIANPKSDAVLSATSGQFQWSRGPFGPAVYLIGNSTSSCDIYTCGTDPALDITGPLTILSIMACTSYGLIFGGYDPNGPYPGYALGINVFNDGAGHANFWCGGTLWSSGTAYVIDGFYHHVAVTYQNNTTKFYIDGFPDVLSAGVSSDPPNNTGVLKCLGGLGGSNNGFSGLIENVFVYNRALSQAEIAQHFVDPYQMLRPKRLLRKGLAFVPAVGAAAGSGTGAVLSFYFGGSASILNPDADSATGSWKNETGGTPPYPSIDESGPADADYIISNQNLTTDTCKVSLSNPSGSIVAPLAVLYRFKSSGGSTPINLRVRLMEGTTQITSWTHTNIAANFVTVEQVLTSGELASIVDPTNLFLEFQATK